MKNWTQPCLLTGRKRFDLPLLPTPGERFTQQCIHAHVPDCGKGEGSESERERFLFFALQAMILAFNSYVVIYVNHCLHTLSLSLSLSDRELADRAWKKYLSIEKSKISGQQNHTKEIEINAQSQGWLQEPDQWLMHLYHSSGSCYFSISSDDDVNKVACYLNL